jgi:hypothetical protein
MVVQSPKGVKVHTKAQGHYIPRRETEFWVQCFQVNFLDPLPAYFLSMTRLVDGSRWPDKGVPMRHEGAWHLLGTFASCLAG